MGPTFPLHQGQSLSASVLRSLGCDFEIASVHAYVRGKMLSTENKLLFFWILSDNVQKYCSRNFIVKKGPKITLQTHIYITFFVITDR